MSLHFPGADKLIATLDAAVALGDDQAVTDALRRGIGGLIRDDGVALPDCVFQPIADHYARRELYTSPEHGYSVIAMTWGPGQGTKIHDHSGMWCVEGVWHGRLEITQYELAERDIADADRFRFIPVGTIEAGAGSCGSLIPPHEYHTIRNPSADSVAVSLHVYQRSMLCCGVFVPEADGPWQHREERKLGTDEANSH
ncbi:cysteine dioxygenase [Pseudoxanthomonas kalamensis DSM 18571]|uniref:cysteine dioxygenase family protein n=1 Tax=Pseudoxanthomonas kalamensis TaxID=289483 RepID=UPI001390B34B|nr:cysteine dioxygenase family protein [Pseudoxanthomonas kalamensis]KAF1710614.1 cysteine dioxygenase [Pseudoxanthomonas kalamensis DSM 18571]